MAEGGAPAQGYARWLDVRASQGDSRAVLDAYDRLTRDQPGFVPSVRAENARLRALKLEGRWVDVVHAVKQWRPAPAPRTLLTYHLAIGTLMSIDRSTKWHST